MQPGHYIRQTWSTAPETTQFVPHGRLQSRLSRYRWTMRFCRVAMPRPPRRRPSLRGTSRRRSPTTESPFAAATARAVWDVVGVLSDALLDSVNPDGTPPLGRSRWHGRGLSGDMPVDQQPCGAVREKDFDRFNRELRGNTASEDGLRHVSRTPGGASLLHRPFEPDLCGGGGREPHRHFVTLTMFSGLRVRP